MSDDWLVDKINIMLTIICDDVVRVYALYLYSDLVLNVS